MQWPRYFLFLAVLAGCDKSPRLPNPSGDEASVTSDFPAVVMLNARRFCTGVFISPETLLTAAHCVNGATRITLRSQNKVVETYQYRTFGSGRPEDIQDIAVVWVGSPVISEEEVLPVSFSGVTAGEEVTLVGYGCNRFESRAGAGQKRRGENIVYRVDDFIELASPLRTLKRLVGDRRLTAACEGDSGGPLLRKRGNGKYEVVGITHGGVEEDSYYLSLYADLSRHRNDHFIRDHIR